MNDCPATDLSEQGFAIVRDVLSDCDLEPLEDEFNSLLDDRIIEWKANGRISWDPGRTTTCIRERLLHLASQSGFDEAFLGDLDITLAHQPFSSIKGDSPFHVGPALLGLVSSPRLLTVLAPIIGSDITLSPNGHTRFKLPAAGKAGITPWHRDAMTHDPASDPVSVVTCWIPMEDVAEENGCLVVVPGGHRAFPELSWPLTAEIVAELDAKAQPLPACKGDIVLLDKNVPHASIPNHSANVRWSFDLRYYPTPGPSDRPWFPSLEVCRSDGFETLSLDADDWKHRWEKVRQRFASSGVLVPGRPEYARAVAEQHIRRWSDGGISPA
jgi:phytanoyl-CoA hydroxylase